jgi:hypothetical protein
MFRHCLWYRVYNKDIVNLINTLSRLFNTNPYFPHLTIEHSLSLIESKKKFHTIKNKKLPTFTMLGKPYQTKTRNFYAIQQDYCSSFLDTSKIFHISLAYKVGSPFTEKQIAMLDNYHIPNIIIPSDMNIELWNCDSVITLDWYKIM